MSKYYETLTVPLDDNKDKVSLWLGKLGKKDNKQIDAKGVWKSRNNSNHDVLFRGYVLFYTDKNTPKAIKALGRVAIRGMLVNEFTKPIGIISILGPTKGSIINNSDNLTTMFKDVYQLKNQRLLVNNQDQNLLASSFDVTWEPPHLKIRVTLTPETFITDSPQEITIQEGIFFCEEVSPNLPPKTIAVPQYEIPIKFINCCKNSILEKFCKVEKSTPPELLRKICEDQVKRARYVWEEHGPLKINVESMQPLINPTYERFSSFTSAFIDEKDLYLKLKKLDNKLTGRDYIGVYFVDQIDSSMGIHGVTPFPQSNGYIVLVVGEALGNDNLLAHELGHILGLEHPGEHPLYAGTKDSIMEKSCTCSSNTLENCQKIFSNEYGLTQPNDIFTIVEPTAKAVPLFPG